MVSSFPELVEVRIYREHMEHLHMALKSMVSWPQSFPGTNPLKPQKGGLGFPNEILHVIADD